MALKNNCSRQDCHFPLSAFSLRKRGYQNSVGAVPEAKIFRETELSDDIGRVRQTWRSQFPFQERLVILLSVFLWQECLSNSFQHLHPLPSWCWEGPKPLLIREKRKGNEKDRNTNDNDFDLPVFIYGAQKMPTLAFRWYTGKILSLNVISVGKEILQIKYVGNVE